MDKKRIWGIIGFVGIVAVILVFVLQRGGDPYIDFVKQATPASYPNITYGEALKNDCRNRSWRHFPTRYEGESVEVVEFKGNCNIFEENDNIEIRFAVDLEEETFRILEMTVGVVTLDSSQINSVFKVMFEDCKQAK